MSDPEPSRDPPARILPIPPEARPKIPDRPRGPPPIRPPDVVAPEPMFTSLAYVFGVLPVIGAIKVARDQFAVPGNDFASMISFGVFFWTLIACVIMGITFALFGYARGERRALRALWLAPLLAAVFEAGGCFLVVI